MKRARVERTRDQVSDFLENKIFLETFQWAINEISNNLKIYNQKYKVVLRIIYAKKLTFEKKTLKF